MKLLLTTLLLLFAILQADDLPNTGLQEYEGEYNGFLEGNYYYGEGVTFGGIPVEGGWKHTCSRGDIQLDANGSATGGGVIWDNPVYFVNEAGTELRIETNADSALFYVREYGNNGCLFVGYSYTGDISRDSSCDICKTTYNAKIYGSKSNRVNIWVGN